MNVEIIGTGRCIPEVVVDEKEFLDHTFYNEKGELITSGNQQIINKFRAITGIRQRRYAAPGQTTSDLAAVAAARALDDAGIAYDRLDGIICAHNFGDVSHGSTAPNTVPSLASRVKHVLGISKPECVAFDVLFGCPGWLQGLIIARQFLLTGAARYYLVIGAESLSRVLDPHDRDAMIYADGAAATVLAATNNVGHGIQSHASLTFAQEELNYLYVGQGYAPDDRPGKGYLKMFGRKIYEFALQQVPMAMKQCLDQTGKGIGDLKKIFIHQANEKMDEAIVNRFYQLYGTVVPKDIMPMNIHLLGNSSVATIPTLFDLVRREEFEGHKIASGDLVMFASIGAGMNINAMTYIV